MAGIAGTVHPGAPVTAFGLCFTGCPGAVTLPLGAIERLSYQDRVNGTFAPLIWSWSHARKRAISASLPRAR